MAGFNCTSSLLLHRIQTHQHAGPSSRSDPAASQKIFLQPQRPSMRLRRVVLIRANDEGPLESGKLGPPVDVNRPLGSGKLGPTVEDNYEEAFDEGAAQVQRLLSRDRKELTGIEDLGQGFQAEFDESAPEREIKKPEGNGAKQQPKEKGTKQAASKPSSFSSGKPAAPFGKAPGGSSPFGAPSKAKAIASKAATPFSGAGNQNLFKEMDNLSPYMQPDQMEDKPWWQNISLGQVLIVLSFTLIIGLMIGTFTVVYKVGAIRFNE